MIYEPKGKAREYSPLAINLYKGCGHKCVYCYVPNAIKITRDEFDNNVTPKANITREILKAVKKYSGTDKQVLMSFSTDPYNPSNDKYHLTRVALNLFRQYRIPSAILSKAGTKVLKDLDVIKTFGEHIKVGASLTLTNDKDSGKWESEAALPADRFKMLQTFKENGVKTWASLEPVLDPEQILEIIDITHSYVDEYQVGKLNHLKNQIDWRKFLIQVLEKLARYEKEFYIKKDLAEFAPDVLSYMDPKYTDMDYLTLPAFEKETADVLFNNWK